MTENVTASFSITRYSMRSEQSTCPEELRVSVLECTQAVIVEKASALRRSPLGFEKSVRNEGAANVARSFLNLADSGDAFFLNAATLIATFIRRGVMGARAVVRTLYGKACVKRCGP
jgi:hypothetical protein